MMGQWENISPEDESLDHRTSIAEREERRKMRGKRARTAAGEREQRRERSSATIKHAKLRKENQK